MGAEACSLLAANTTLVAALRKLLADPAGAAGGPEDATARHMAMQVLCTLSSTAPQSLASIWNSGFTLSLQRALLRDPRMLEGQVGARARGLLFGTS